MWTVYHKNTLGLYLSAKLPSTWWKWLFLFLFSFWWKWINWIYFVLRLKPNIWNTSRGEKFLSVSAFLRRKHIWASELHQEMLHYSTFTNQGLLCCMGTFLLLCPFSTCFYLYFSRMSCAWETVLHSLKKHCRYTFTAGRPDAAKTYGFAQCLSCNRPIAFSR